MKHELDVKVILQQETKNEKQETVIEKKEIIKTMIINSDHVVSIIQEDDKWHLVELANGSSILVSNKHIYLLINS